MSLKNIRNQRTRPFTLLIPKTLEEGNIIELEATISPEAYSFSISMVPDHRLRCVSKTVNFHFKMDLLKKQVILNRKRGNMWIKEVTVINTAPLPDPGDKFKMFVWVRDPKTFTVYVNNNFHSDYFIGLGIEEIKYFQIWEGLDKVNSFRLSSLNGAPLITT